jgi:hypothetical protein
MLRYPDRARRQEVAVPIAWFHSVSKKFSGIHRRHQLPPIFRHVVAVADDRADIEPTALFHGRARVLAQHRTRELPPASTAVENAWHCDVYFCSQSGDQMPRICAWIRHTPSVRIVKSAGCNCETARASTHPDSRSVAPAPFKSDTRA